MWVGLLLNDGVLVDDLVGELERVHGELVYVASLGPQQDLLVVTGDAACGDGLQFAEKRK